jgi:CO/xanthine dehydrogenase FAD-binding subunit
MFAQPKTLEEALALKAQYGATSAFIAGGTDLIVLMNHGRTPANVFIDLSHIEGLDFLERGQLPSSDPLLANLQADEAYVCGPVVTFARLADLPVRCLAEAARSVGGPQIRNRATIAGNLATASPAGDGSTALLSLDAWVELRSRMETRVLPLRNFFVDYRKTALRPDEIISRIAFPATWRTGWRKLGKRGAMNISLVCCSVGVGPDWTFHVAFGSVGPYPLVAHETANFLTSAARAQGVLPVNAKTLEETAQIAAQEVRPIDDFRGSADYRRAMAGALLKKVLRSLAGIEPAVAHH